MSNSYFYQGHEIYFNHGCWRFKSDGTETSESEFLKRGCGFCGLNYIQDAGEVYDGCMGKIKGSVMNACCGHGNDSDAYVQFFGDKENLSGHDALEYIALNKSK